MPHRTVQLYRYTDCDIAVVSADLVSTAPALIVECHNQTVELELAVVDEYVDDTGARNVIIPGCNDSNRKHMFTITVTCLPFLVSSCT